MTTLLLSSEAFPNGNNGKHKACFTMIWINKQKVHNWLF
jgi:hypothetical protein